VKDVENFTDNNKDMLGDALLKLHRDRLMRVFGSNGSC